MLYDVSSLVYRFFWERPMTPDELIAKVKAKVDRDTRRKAKQEIQPCAMMNCGQGEDMCSNCYEAQGIQSAKDEVAIAEIKALGYDIVYNPPPIPMRNCDWQFCHEDYDGPGDFRCGCGSCPEMCLERVREMCIEWGDLDD